MLRAGFRYGHRYARGIAAQPNGLIPVPASSVRDPGWVDVQLKATARRFRLTRVESVGVLWWYSASSVLLGPAVSSVVRGGDVADPALDSMVMVLHADGRVLEGRSVGVVSLADLGSRLMGALSEGVAAVVSGSGASERALWAVATDSLANQVLWAGGGPGVAVELAASVGAVLPVPRFVSVGGNLVVRRASCCLIYQGGGAEKCVSCPRQRPEEREGRLRAAFGVV